ncbi:hypothetical protein YC2023_081331 [Brassica napus]
MAGTKRRKKTGKSAAKTPSPLSETSTAQPPAASDLVRQTPPPPRPRGSQTSATEQPPPCQSHASSQAQNSDSTQSPEGEFPEESTPVHPTLSEDQMRGS